MSKKVGIVRFLGTNCDYDIQKAVQAVGHNPEWLWHKDLFDESRYDAIIIPGGFSYGDYLRSGAVAARSKVMTSVRKAVERGVPTLGICNGFQILCESEILPGVLLKNESLKFIDKFTVLRLAGESVWSPDGAKSVSLPIAHGDGRYYIEENELNLLKDNDEVWCRYTDNPNGSVDDIAGVIGGPSRNVAAMMPHPERALFDWMGSDDGFNFFS